MEIKIKKIEDFEIGFNRLKEAKLELAGNENIYAYKDVEIILSDLYATDIVPTTFYALKANLAFQETLRKELMNRFRIELFDLPGIMYLEIDKRIVGLVPPFVEVYTEKSGSKVWSLQDGIHRFLLAKESGIKQKCIVIKSDSRNGKYLPYAYPNAWDEVVLVDHVPTIKKKFRRKIKYSFMRPLREIFDSDMVHSWFDYGRN